MTRTPDELAPLIRRDIEQGVEAARKAAPQHYQRVGELLLEAWGQIANEPEFTAWVKRHFGLTKVAAYEMMLHAATKQECSAAKGLDQ